MKHKKPLYRMLIGAATLLMAAFSMTAQASTSVSWNSPADGSVFPVGTMVMPDGTASGIGQTGNGLDLVLVLDSSGSMTALQTVGPITQSRREWQQDAAIALVNSLPANNVSVSIVEFDSSANLVRQLSPLLTDKAAIIAAINSVDASGGTNIGTGIAVATTELTGANHTAGRSQQMVVFSDGSTSGIPANDAAAALVAGVDSVHSVLLPGGNLATMQSIAAAGNGTFIDASTAQGIVDLIALFQGFGGSLVGIDHVDIVMPDGTFLGSVAVDAFGNFKTPGWLMQLGPNSFLATAFATDGTSATAKLTLLGRDGGTSVPEPGILALLGLGLIGMTGARRRKL
jgi:Ca-activated chloride channel family protein